MMKTLIAALTLAASSAFSQTVTPPVVAIERTTLGSGTPGQYGFEQAVPVLENDIYHAPQYMPYMPTAATIWPRIVEVPCHKVADTLKCDGYVFDGTYRAEYLFFKTKIVEEPKPVVVIHEITKEVILKEVPIKKPRE